MHPPSLKGFYETVRLVGLHFIWPGPRQAALVSAPCPGRAWAFGRSPKLWAWAMEGRLTKRCHGQRMQSMAPNFQALPLGNGHQSAVLDEHQVFVSILWDRRDDVLANVSSESTAGKANIAATAAGRFPPKCLQAVLQQVACKMQSPMKLNLAFSTSFRVHTYTGPCQVARVPCDPSLPQCSE